MIASVFLAVLASVAVWSEPIRVVEGETSLYLPHIYGWRIRHWPKEGRKLAGKNPWIDRGEGVYELTGEMKYPSKFATMAFAAVSQKNERGVYFAVEEKTSVAADFAARYDSRKGELRLGFSFPDGRRGNVVEREFSGAWYEAAKMYRKWWDGSHRMVSIPDSARDMTGFMMVILKQQNGDVVWPYTDFASLGETARKMGLTHVEFHGWGKGGHDRLYPEYVLDEGMGGTNALMKGVAELKKTGLHVSVYSNGQLQQHGGTDFFGRYGTETAILKEDGEPLQECWVKYHNVPGVTFDVTCPWSEAWSGQMLKICRDAKALGFQGFFYDQIGKQWPWACYAENHGHKKGDYVFTGDRVRLFNGISEKMRAEDRDFVLWSEAFNDTLLESVALYQGLGYVNRGGWSVENRFAADNGADMFPELTFVTFPELVMTDRADTSFATRERVNGCLVTGLRIDLEVRYPADRRYLEGGVVPGAADYAKMVHPPSEWRMMTAEAHDPMMAYLKEMNDFRRANGDLLLRGRFRADEGFVVKGGEKIVANRFDAENGDAGVLVWNAGAEKTEVEVELDGRKEKGEIAANSLKLFRFAAEKKEIADAPKWVKIVR